MKKLLMILLASALSIEAMDTNSFSSLKDNMGSSIDSAKIKMLNELSSETYTSEGNFRANGLRKLSS
jgi:hypothetical protein